MISALLTRRTWFLFECSSLLSSDYWRTTWIQMIQVEVLWRTLAPDIEFSILPFTFLSLSMPVWLNNFDSKRLGTIDWRCCPIRCSRAGKKMSINLKKFEVSRGLGFAQSLLHSHFPSLGNKDTIFMLGSTWGLQPVGPSIQGNNSVVHKYNSIDR